ncbi:hypothetical protein ACH9L7_10435 [Haloferax sp. S1W]|uniref:hypothetical protein n=1 Tax=Haloferax sp. S1W TaxID=3377110 RepID=UPI0037CBC51A
MVGASLHTLTVVFSLVSGTTAGILSLLAWESLRQSPFGRAVVVLSFVMAVFTLYHVFVLVYPNPEVLVQVFKSLVFTGVALFVWTMVWCQYRLRTTVVTGQAND